MPRHWTMTSAIALATGLMGAPFAMAEAPTPSTGQSGETTGAGQAAPASAGLEEIVVTARRRAENIQKTPVAITAFSAADIGDHQVTAMSDLGSLTPSLTFRESNYTPFGSYIGIRGQRTGDIILSQTPSIGIYVDDVYEATSNGAASASMADVQQIEVLKGPQGTLYGRNTTGGALKITTALPNYDGYSGSLKVGFGNFDSNVVSGVVNIPLVDDMAALRLAGERDYNSGYGRDIKNNRDLDDVDSKNLRAALRLDLADDLQLVFRGDWSDNRSGGQVTPLAGVSPVFNANGTPNFWPALLDVGVATGRINPVDLGLLATGNAAAAGRVIGGEIATYNYLQSYIKQYSGYTQYYPDPIGDRVRSAGGSLTATYSFSDDLTLKSITAYRYEGQDALNQAVPGPVTILDGPADVTNPGQTTQELQLSGISLDSKLKWTAGYYYFYLTGNDDSPGENELPYINPDSPVNTRVHLFDESNSIYGQGTYSLTDTVNFTGGLRWTTESTELLAHSTTGVANICNLPPPAGIGGAPCAADFTNSFRNVSYTAGLDWAVTDSLLVYAKTSRGFKAGGQNQRGTAAGGFDPFAPEVVTDYEIGSKWDGFDHKFRVNAAAYHSDYTNIQRTVNFEPPGSFQTISEIKNAASATIDGVELELTAKPIESVTIHGGLAYTEAQYLKFINNGVDDSGIPFESQPKWQGNLSVAYNVPLSIGSLLSTIDYSYQSKTNLDPEDGSIYTNGLTTQQGYSLVNARVVLDIEAYDLEIAGWVKNLTDESYHTSALDLSGNLGAVRVTLSKPRTFGFDVTKHF